MSETITPIFNLDSELLPVGYYHFRVKETGIDESERESGRRFWARMTVVGGAYEGRQFTESFFEKTKDNFSLRRLAGFLITIGVLKNPNNISPDIFFTEEFRKRWLNSVPGKELGIKIGHRELEKGTFPEARAYLTVSDLSKHLSEKQLKKESKPEESGTASVWD